MASNSRLGDYRIARVWSRRSQIVAGRAIIVAEPLPSWVIDAIALGRPPHWVDALLDAANRAGYARSGQAGN